MAEGVVSIGASGVMLRAIHTTRSETLRTTKRGDAIHWANDLQQGVYDTKLVTILTMRNVCIVPKFDFRGGNEITVARGLKNENEWRMLHLRMISAGFTTILSKVSNSRIRRRQGDANRLICRKPAGA